MENNIIIVNNQAELDAIPLDYKGQIHILGNIDRINQYYPNAEIHIKDNAAVSNVYDNATVMHVYGNATVSNVYDNATVRRVTDNATVSDVYGNATVSDVTDNATVSIVTGNATVSDVYGNTAVRYVYDNATVRCVSDNATVRCVSDNATVMHVYGRAIIRDLFQNVTVQTLGQNIVSYNKSEVNVKVDASLYTVVMLLDKESTFEWYQKEYPVQVVDSFAILYKSVHKLEDGKYVADKDNSFEYVVGSTHTHVCNPSTEESCTYGLHVSHKMWALRFGSGWNNMALLECKVPVDKIVVAKDCDGKVRTSELLVIREVPKEEYYK